MHDALQDCKAAVRILKTKKATFDKICSCTRSMESVQQRVTNPLLKAGVITETVAAKMPNQMTCKKYLELSDEELTTILKSNGIKNNSIAICVSKRNVYVSEQLREPSSD